MKYRLLGGLAVSALAATMAGPALSFEGMSVSAENCDYGGKIQSIEATSELEVVFTMCKPDPAFEAKVAFTPFGIQPSEHIAEAGPSGSLIEDPIGTGPFKLDSWNRGDSVIMSTFEDYWGEMPAFDTLVIRWNDSSAGRLNELMSGQVDQITNLGPDDFETVQNDDNLQFLAVANPNTMYFAMTNTFEPFNDPKVRKAIAMGIDRQRIVDNFYPEGSEVADYFTPCSLPNACQGDPWYDFDPEAAKELLAEAGYPDGFDTSIYFRDVVRGYLPEPSVVAVEFQTQLRDNLGINAEVVVMESGEFIDESGNGRLDGFYLLGWGADYPHITNFLDYHFGRGTLQFGDDHPEIYEPLLEASTIADLDKAAPIYAEANNAIRELVPMVPIAHGASASAAQASLEGAHFRPFGAPRFEVDNPGKDTLVFMQNAEPISLYCADETDGESLAVCQQIVEPLLKYGLDSGETQPGLATGCEANEDSSVWTCALREGVTFHDGSAFDADDVVASWAAGIDASADSHVGNTGAFFYYSYLWDGFMNAPASE